MRKWIFGLVPMTALIATTGVREAVDARYVHDASGAKSMLSIVPAFHAAQEP